MQCWRQSLVQGHPVLVEVQKPAKMRACKARSRNKRARAYTTELLPALFDSHQGEGADPWSAVRTTGCDRDRDGVCDGVVLQQRVDCFASVLSVLSHLCVFM